MPCPDCGGMELKGDYIHKRDCPRKVGPRGCPECGGPAKGQGNFSHQPTCSRYVAPVPTGPADWNELSTLASVALFPSTHHEKRYDKGQWFRHFWGEALAGAGQAGENRDKMVTLFNTLFKRNPNGTAPPFVFRKSLDSYNDTEIKGFLQTLLEIGHEKLPVDGKWSDQDSQRARLEKYVVAAEHVRTWGEYFSGADVPRVQVEVAWRSDDRSYKDVMSDQHQGFRTASDSDDYARSLGMREDWHPLNDPENRKFFWYRKNQKDNCTYTVVSVGTNTDWKASAVHPLWKIKNPQPLMRVKVECLINGNPASAKLPATYPWIYLTMLTEFLFDTGGLQGKEGIQFPEKGVKRIAPQDVFGAFRVFRFAHGDGDEPGFTAFIDPSSIQVTPQAEDGPQRREKYGEVFQRLYQKFYAATIDQRPFHIKWTSDGFEPVPAAYVDSAGRTVEITRLVNSPPTTWPGGDCVLCQTAFKPSTSSFSRWHTCIGCRVKYCPDCGKNLGRSTTLARTRKCITPNCTGETQLL